MPKLYRIEVYPKDWNGVQEREEFANTREEAVSAYHKARDEGKEASISAWSSMNSDYVIAVDLLEELTGKILM